MAYHSGTIRAIYPAAPGLILDIHKIFILDVAEIYLWLWSEECGHVGLIMLVEPI